MKCKNIKWFCLLLLFIFSSCTFQKRLYNKGFYISKQSGKKNEEKKYIDTTTLVIHHSKAKKTTSTLTASLNQPTFIKSTLLSDGCDTIVLRSGSKILGNITEINLTKVLFKNCNSTDESIIFIKKTEINYVAFTNGTKEVFNPEADYNQPNNLPEEKINRQSNRANSRNKKSNNYDQPSGGKLNTFSLISFIISAIPYPFIIILAAIFGMVSLISKQNLFASIFAAPHTSPFLAVPFLFVIVAIILSAIAIYQIKNNGEENKKGLKLAYIALVLSLLLLLLLLLFTF